MRGEVGRTSAWAWLRVPIPLSSATPVSRDSRMSVIISRWLTPKKFVSFAARLRFCSNEDISGGGLVMLYAECIELIDGQSGRERLRSSRLAVAEDGTSGSLES